MSQPSEDPSGLAVSNVDPEIKRKIADYWDRRSRGYNLSTLLELKDSARYEALIDSVLPPGKPSRVLDLGTSCGLMALIAARLGHNVTAVDFSSAMIKHAKLNASKFRLDIEFLQADMEDLNLPRCEFDLIIMKSSIWLLQEPAVSISRFISFLKPGGHLLIVDGNYYLGQYDPEYARMTYEGKDNSGLHGMTNMDGVDFSEIRALSASLPVCRLRRPAWDVSLLLGLGLKDIRINCLDAKPFRILTDAGILNLPYSFSITASLPVVQQRAAPAEDSSKIRFHEFIEPSTDLVFRLKALADVNRLKIVNALSILEMTVSELAIATGLSASLVSHNLKILKQAGFVRTIKRGKETMVQIQNYNRILECRQILENL